MNPYDCNRMMITCAVINALTLCRRLLTIKHALHIMVQGCFSAVSSLVELLITVETLTQ